MANVKASTHPLIQHKLARLRDVATRPQEFRGLVRELSTLLAYEATASLALRDVPVTTPLRAIVGKALADTIGIVPILRAGLGMADGVLELIPEAEVWHLGMFRDELTLRPTEYYNKLPRNSRITLALVLDPMLATGGSAVRACEVVKQSGVDRIAVISLIAAPEGIDVFTNAMPDVSVHVGVIDECLNEHGFIVPGLGDAGDRQFATL